MNIYRNISLLGEDPRQKTIEFLNETKQIEKLEKVLAEQVLKGDIKGAKETASILRRKLTTKELEEILKKQKAIGLMPDARETASMLPEPKRTIELKRILERQMVEDFKKNKSTTSELTQHNN